VHLEDPNLHQSFGNISNTNDSHSSQTPEWNLSPKPMIGNMQAYTFCIKLFEHLRVFNMDQAKYKVKEFLSIIEIPEP
jgi:hypothetical protein